MVKYKLLFLLLFPHLLIAQQFFRVKADFSIKSKLTNGSGQLTMGTVFYDKTTKKIVYRNRFPEKETWVSVDSFMYKIVNENVISKQNIPSLAEFTVFHLALNGNLADYGLKNTSFTVEKVEKEKGQVITTWKPSPKLSKAVGKIMVSQKDKCLNGIVFFNPKGEIITKQFFNKYQNFNGLQFPCETIQITYVNGKEAYQMATYSNIVVNDFKDDDIYNFVIPNH